METSRGTVVDRNGRPVTITPSHRVYGFGAILLVSLTICSRKLGSVGEPSFIIPLVVAGVAYLFAIRELFATPKFPSRVILIGLLLAVLWQIPFLLAPPGSDDDVHRYLWDGRVQRLGYTLMSSFPAILRSPGCTHPRLAL